MSSSSSKQKKTKHKNLSVSSLSTLHTFHAHILEWEVDETMIWWGLGQNKIAVQRTSLSYPNTLSHSNKYSPKAQKSPLEQPLQEN